MSASRTINNSESTVEAVASKLNKMTVGFLEMLQIHTATSAREIWKLARSTPEEDFVAAVTRNCSTAKPPRAPRAAGTTTGVKRTVKSGAVSISVTGDIATNSISISSEAEPSDWTDGSTATAATAATATTARADSGSKTIETVSVAQKVAVPVVERDW